MSKSTKPEITVNTTKFFKGIKKSYQVIVNSTYAYKRSMGIKALLSKAKKTGQSRLADSLNAELKFTLQELKAINAGYNKVLDRVRVVKLMDRLADKDVYVSSIADYPREIPDEVVEQLPKFKELFDDIFIIYTDYNSDVAKKIKVERDPVMLGIFHDKSTDRFAPDMFFLADWTDDFCDLTLDGLIDAYADIATDSDDKLASKEGHLKDSVDSVDLANDEKLLLGIRGKNSAK